MALEDLSLHDKPRNYEDAPRYLSHRERAVKLSDLDAESELLDNYNDAKDLLTNLGDETPANQKAQVLNTINAVLGNIIKQRAELHNMERFKSMETALIYTLKQFPELQEVFLEEYERLLKGS